MRMAKAVPSCCCWPRPLRLDLRPAAPALAAGGNVASCARALPTLAARGAALLPRRRRGPRRAATLLPPLALRRLCLRAAARRHAPLPLVVQLPQQGVDAGVGTRLAQRHQVRRVRPVRARAAGAARAGLCEARDRCSDSRRRRLLKLLLVLRASQVGDEYQVCLSARPGAQARPREHSSDLKIVAIQPQALERRAWGRIFAVLRVEQGLVGRLRCMQRAAGREDHVVVHPPPPGLPAATHAVVGTRLARPLD
ncbi:MAG: hypothetical protein J3K34DRAFT_270474 [Monoraphidium minutum]|nr:MAG: hypothetical protein J3K34DRAFT_270474 [Monoraphidium minutum]